MQTQQPSHTLTPQQRLAIAELRLRRLDDACDQGASSGWKYGAGAGGAIGGLTGFLGGPIGVIRGIAVGAVSFGAIGMAAGCPIGIGLQHLRDSGFFGAIDWNEELRAAQTPRPLANPLQGVPTR